MSGIIKLWKDERGAVSPTVALSLVGLIASGGIAFDYAQLAALDTELQQAADQAALAAATQLDGATGACVRAAAAASSLLGLWASYQLDLPTGAAIVCACGVMLVVVSFLKHGRH